MINEILNFEEIEKKKTEKNCLLLLRSNKFKSCAVFLSKISFASNSSILFSIVTDVSH
jgi:hypothetical protein